MKKLLLTSLVAVATVNLSACSTISDWFADDEELAIRHLKPIEMKFEAQELWDESVGDGVDHYFSRLTPAVGYDKVYAADRQGHVVAFDQKTGEEVWEKNFAQFSDEGFFSFMEPWFSDGISARISGGLTVSYETLFFGTENGEVMALDVTTGDVKWKSEVKGEVLAAPVVDSGVVVVNTGAGTMIALDAGTGEQKWTYESEVPPLSLRGISAPAAAGGGVLAGTANGKLVVNIIESGQTAWEQAITSPSGATELERIVDIDSQPLVLGGVAFVISYDGTLAAVELRSGRVIWKREYQSYRRITTDNTNLYLVDVKSNVYALDRRNGVELWSQGQLKGRTLTGAVPVKEYVVVGDNWGYLHWLDKKDGTIVSRLEVGDDDEDESIYTEPVVVDDIIYTQTRDGRVVAVQTP